MEPTAATEQPDIYAAEFPDDAEIRQPPPTIESLLNPKSPLHGKVLSRLKARDTLSEQFMQNRYDAWDRVDEKRRLYVNLARPARRGDKNVIPGKLELPFERAIVMPMTYAIHETRVSEMVSQYLFRAPFSQFDGRGLEDIKPAKLAEVKLEYDYQESDGPLSVYQLISDANAYGVGVLYDSWEEESGWQTVPVDPMIAQYAQMLGMPAPEPTRQFGPIKQYTNWAPVDPYLWRPDPRVSPTHIQDSEFVGHKTFRSLLWLLERTQENGGSYFNVEELQKSGTAEGQDSRTSPRGRGNLDSSQFLLKGSSDEKDKGFFTLTNMQVKIVPKDWGLGEETQPMIWWFTYADDKTIVRAHPSPYDHNEFTYAAGEVNADMHQHANPGNAELMDGLQRTVDWLTNSRVENVRKFLNDMLIFSPELIEEDDIANPGPARWIRMTLAGTKAAMQGMKFQDMIQQMQVSDVTGTHFEVTQFLMDMANKLGAANDTMQGQQLPDKRTLGEINNAVGFGTKRLTVASRIIDAQVFKALATRAVSNAQQFYDINQWVRVVGDYSQIDPEGLGRLQVSKQDLAGNFDYVPMSALTPQDPARMMSVWNALFQMGVSTPQLSMPDPIDPTVLDIKHLFKMVARLGGAREVDAMFKQMPMAPGLGAPGVLPDEQIQAGVQAGNMVPLDAYQGGMGQGGAQPLG